jgi:hypothetical protein
MSEFSEAIEYEKITQTIYQNILKTEGVNNIKVEHNVDIPGRSGVAHQVDVMWNFRQANIEHVVLIECKNYNSNITLEKIRNFFGVLYDIGNAKGIMVTKTGYQKGVVRFARYYGIGLKLLREPLKEDWENRVRNIHFQIFLKFAVSTKEKPIEVQVYLSPENEEQKGRIVDLQKEGKLLIPTGADRLCLKITSHSLFPLWH